MKKLYPIRLILGIVLIFSPTISGAQPLSLHSNKPINPWVQEYTINNLSLMGKRAAIETPVPYTALAIQVASGNTLKGAFLEIDGEKIPLVKDLHHPDPDWISSGLISMNGLSQEFVLLPGPNMGNEVRVVLLDSGPTPPLSTPRSRGEMDEMCDAPAAIAQSEWRSGLPNPTGQRSFSEIKNLIVHHSAGSNTATNYTQVVRDIYIFHTEYRGWSDVGYNYLIAQDGTLYAGRDPQGGDQTSVIGAHFCGGNSGTMGVCLLGTYTNTSPTEETFQTLESILSFKAFQDELDPLGHAAHRLNNNLPVIAGHRDGCSTECPGEQTYRQLQVMRDRVDRRLKVCKEDVEPEEPIQPEDSIRVTYLNSTYPYLRVFATEPSHVAVNQARMVDTQGKSHSVEFLSFGPNTWEIPLRPYAPGIYVLQMVVSGEIRSKRVIVL